MLTEDDRRWRNIYLVHSTIFELQWWFYSFSRFLSLNVKSMYLFTEVVDVFLKKFYFQAPKYLTIPTNLIFAGYMRHHNIFWQHYCQVFLLYRQVQNNILIPSDLIDFQSPGTAALSRWSSAAGPRARASRGYPEKPPCHCPAAGC